MAIRLKSEKDIEILREGGKRHAFILNELAKMIVPETHSIDLEKCAKQLISEGGDTPAFLGYRPNHSKRPFPASLCLSINDEVVHGIPNEKDRIIEEGDVVSLDLGIVHKGLFTDSAITVIAGKGTKQANLLVNATKEALYEGISQALPQNKVGDISSAIEKIGRKYNLGIIEELAGHGVGFAVHEDPFIPNYGSKGTGPLLKPGMVIAIEPMFTLGGREIYEANDGYTICTRDGSLSAHFEHTVLILEDGFEILTE